MHKNWKRKMKKKNEKLFWHSQKLANGHSPIGFSVLLGVRMCSESEEKRRRCSAAPVGPRRERNRNPRNRIGDASSSIGFLVRLKGVFHFFSEDWVSGFRGFGVLPWDPSFFSVFRSEIWFLCTETIPGRVRVKNKAFCSDSILLSTRE